MDKTSVGAIGVLTLDGGERLTAEILDFNDERGELIVDVVSSKRPYPDSSQRRRTIPVSHVLSFEPRSGAEQPSGLGVFKELAPIVAIPFVGVGTALLAGLGLKAKNPWAIQIASPILHTYAVFLFVFCDTGRGFWRQRRGDLKGYSLREKAVREKLPLLFCIHAGFLAVVFGVETSTIFVRTHLFLSYFGARDLDFDAIVLLTTFFICFAILLTQIGISRGILGRALKDERSNARP